MSLAEDDEVVFVHAKLRESAANISTPNPPSDSFEAQMKSRS